MVSPVPEPEPTTQQLQCMEIWDGNSAIHNAISVPGIDAWISSDPFHGDSVGGDIHFISTCGAGRISRFFIADVAGHGNEVGEIAGRLHELMRKHINTLDQTRFAQALNHELLKLSKAGQFATALLTTYFAPTDHLVICNAGHPRPFWYHADAGFWEPLDPLMPHREETLVNLPLGVVEPTDYVQFAIKLGKGDLILIYTDSLIEARNFRGEMLGEGGLLELVRALEISEVNEVSQQILAAVADYQDHLPAEDDQTLLLLHHNGADPPKPTFGRRFQSLAKMLGLANF